MRSIAVAWNATRHCRKETRRYGQDHWTRTQDLKLTMYTVLADPETTARINTSQIQAARFSFCGWAAVSLGNLTGPAADCIEYSAVASPSADLMRDDLDPVAFDPDKRNANSSDPRISSIFAIDPALMWGISAKNFYLAQLLVALPDQITETMAATPGL